MCLVTTDTSPHTNTNKDKLFAVKLRGSRTFSVGILTKLLCCAVFDRDVVIVVVVVVVVHRASSRLCSQSLQRRAESV